MILQLVQEVAYVPSMSWLIKKNKDGVQNDKITKNTSERTIIS